MWHNNVTFNEADDVFISEATASCTSKAARSFLPTLEVAAAPACREGDEARCMSGSHAVVPVHTELQAAAKHCGLQADCACFTVLAALLVPGACAGSQS